MGSTSQKWFDTNPWQWLSEDKNINSVFILQHATIESTLKIYYTLEMSFTYIWMEINVVSDYVHFGFRPFISPCFSYSCGKHAQIRNG